MAKADRVARPKSRLRTGLPPFIFRELLAEGAMQEAVEPFVVGALFCERVGTTEEGLTALFGLTNALTLPIGTRLPCVDTELLWLGFAHDGAIARRLTFFSRILGPSGPVAEGRPITIDLKAGELGAEVQLRLQIPIATFGLYVTEIRRAETDALMARALLSVVPEGRSGTA